MELISQRHQHYKHVRDQKKKWKYPDINSKIFKRSHVYYSERLTYIWGTSSNSVVNIRKAIWDQKKKKNQVVIMSKKSIQEMKHLLYRGADFGDPSARSINGLIGNINQIKPRVRSKIKSTVDVAIWPHSPRGCRFALTLLSHQKILIHHLPGDYTRHFCRTCGA
jgi:hypothetical protein